jgi:hypothetical protein
MKELMPILPHITLKPEDIQGVLDKQGDADVADSTPNIDHEKILLESGLGIDMGHMARGGSMSAGANIGPIRSDTPNVRYGRHNSLAPAMLGKAFPLLLKRRKYKGRKYDEEDESEEEERKAKKKKKRKRKRKRKKKGKSARGGREPKSATKRRAAQTARNIDTAARRQAFHPSSRSIPLRMRGSTRSEGIPLRLRDPIAYQRKLSNQRRRNQEGALPRGMTHHRSSAAGVTSTATRGHIIGGTKGTKRIGGGGIGTQMPNPMPHNITSLPPSPKMGIKLDRLMPGATGDPLGTSDPLIRRSLLKGKRNSLTRIELLHLKKKIEALMRRIEKLTKASPELGSESKVGNQASPDRASSPTGGTKLNDEEQAAFRFNDGALALALVGKR